MFYKKPKVTKKTTTANSFLRHRRRIILKAAAYCGAAHPLHQYRFYQCYRIRELRDGAGAL